MIKFTSIAVLPVVFFIGAGAEADAEENDQQLVADLADSDFRKREDAHAALRAVGLRAREALQSAAGSQDVEQRVRVLQLLKELKRDDLWAPSIINFHATKSPLIDVLRIIEEQSGNPFN